MYHMPAFILIDRPETMVRRLFLDDVHHSCQASSFWTPSLSLAEQAKPPSQLEIPVHEKSGLQFLK